MTTASTDLVLVKPWPGLILAEVPPEGAALPRALAEEWIGNHLVIRVPDSPAAIKKPSTRRVNPRGSGATRPRKQRRQ